jgi:hypothetical protein
MTKFGRPLKFKSVKQLQKSIDSYFESLYEVATDMWGNPITDKLYKGKPADDKHPHRGYMMKKTKVATITGLAVWLKTTRETLMDYENGKYDGRDEEGNDVGLTENEKAWNDQVDDFSDTIKTAKLAIFADTEQQLFRPGRSTGAIFSLKVNYGMQDKSVTEISNPDGTLGPISGLSTEDLRVLAEKKRAKADAG